MKRSWLFVFVLVCLIGCVSVSHRPDTSIGPRNAQFETVEAKAFVIRGEDGQVRAKLEITANGNVGMYMYDGSSRKGKDCVFALTVRTNHTANLYFTDQKGRGGFDLIMTSNGPLIDLNPDTRIWFRDYQYSPRVVIGMASNGVPYLNWNDFSRGWIQSIPPLESGTPVRSEPIGRGEPDGGPNSRPAGARGSPHL